MLKGQDRKVNSIGMVSCVGALALGIALLNPLVGASVYAEEAEDYGIDTQALSSSIVRISFSPASGSTSLTPITSAGQSAQINVKATVSVANSGGYSVYLKSNSQNLVGVNNPNNVIPGIAGSTTYDNLSTNTWGYASAEGTAVPEGASYKAISVSGQGDKIAENASNKIVSDTKEIMLSFAAKIGDDMPADTYESTVTMSVVSSPVQLAVGDIADMQQMTSEICENTAPSVSKQLRDVRDGKYYWVSKLADGKCWMTQNLDLDIKTADGALNEDNVVPTEGVWPEASLSDYDEVPRAKVYATSTIADSNTIYNSPANMYSWSLGNVRITKPDESSDCGSAKHDASDCTEQFTTYDTPTSADGDINAHYLLGNHYAWGTVTAGSGSVATGEQAGSSICPKGWRLPTSGTGGEFEVLVAKLGGTSSTDNVTEAPFYGVRGGYVRQTVAFFEHAGNNGTYWSSTIYSPDGGLAYLLSFNGDTAVSPWSHWSRQDSLSVRCVAR